MLLLSDSLAFNQIAPHGCVPVCVSDGRTLLTFPHVVLLCFSDAGSSLSARLLKHWKISRRTPLCAGTAAVHTFSRQTSLAERKQGLDHVVVTACASLPFQMSNPVGLTQTKELQEDPLHKEHEATRYAQWKVRGQTRTPSLSMLQVLGR